MRPVPSPAVVTSTGESSPSATTSRAIPSPAGDGLATAVPGRRVGAAVDGLVGAGAARRADRRARARADREQAEEDQAQDVRAVAGGLHARDAIPEPEIAADHPGCYPAAEEASPRMLDRLISGAGAVTDAADRVVRAIGRGGGEGLLGRRPGSVVVAAICAVLAGILVFAGHRGHRQPDRPRR